MEFARWRGKQHDGNEGYTREILPLALLKDKG